MASKKKEASTKVAKTERQEIETKENKIANKVNKVVKNAVDYADKVGKQAKEIFDDAAEHTREYVSLVSNEADKLIDEARNKTHEAKIKHDKAVLHPIFSSAELEDYQMICVNSKDKKHKESEACKKSIGHYDIGKKDTLKVLYIYNNKMDKFNFEYYPKKENGFFYVSPVDENKLINLDDYFKYVKEERVAELSNIAYCIGASHVLIKYKEEKTTLVNSQFDVNANGKEKNKKIKAGVKANLDNEEKSKEYINISIMNEATYRDNKPKMPELKYYKNDKKIIDLVSAALNGHTDNVKFSVQFDSSSIINKSTAAKIDATLNKYGVTGNGSFSSEIERECRSVLEVELTFPKSK